MNVLACVFLKMQTSDRDFLGTPFDGMAGLIAFGGHDFEFSVCREWLVELGDLIALWEVGVKIVFAREDSTPG